MWLSFFGGDIRKFLENCGVKKRKSVFLKPATKKIKTIMRSLKV